MPIYAKAGESLQCIMTESQARKMPDLVLMSCPRPSALHVADASGGWVLPPTARIAEIDAELMRLDLEAVRPLRAKVAGSGTPEDDARLADIEAHAQALRGERAGLAPV
jgi:hypothetical protein